MLTEASRGGPLEQRRQWLLDSLATIKQLRTDGTPVVGYTWFPFTALIDWAYRESTTPLDDWIVQMGMVDLVRTPGGGTSSADQPSCSTTIATPSTEGCRRSRQQPDSSSCPRPRVAAIRFGAC